MTGTLGTAGFAPYLYRKAILINKKAQARCETILLRAIQAKAALGGELLPAIFENPEEGNAV